MGKTKQKFLMVYEDEWHNKESYITTKLGDTLLEVLKDNDVMLEQQDDIDSYVEKLNSNDPYDMGTFGKGFYDMDVYRKEDDAENIQIDNLEYAGRIMIFVI
jgi:hypothetical protein